MFMCSPQYKSFSSLPLFPPLSLPFLTLSLLSSFCFSFTASKYLVFFQ